MTRPNNAPGCYGIGIASMRSNSVCRNCPAKTGCSESAIDSLQTVSKTVDVSDYLALHKVTSEHTNPTIERYFPSKKINLRKVDKIELKFLMTLPVKVRKVVNTLIKRNLDLSKCLRDNRNPFLKVTPKYLAPAFDLLLKNQHFTKGHLKAVYSDSGWSAGTIRSAVAGSIGVFQAMNLIHSTDSKNYQVIIDDK
jgi:hypothetical protein